MYLSLQIRKSSLRTVTVLAILLLPVAACGDEGVPEEVGQAAVLPVWLDRVYPGVGQEVAIAADVQVNHDVVGPEEAIRLLIDGVDVTRYAAEGRGELVYDPDRPAAEAERGVGSAEDPAEEAEGGPPVPDRPAELSPGTHTATVQRLRVDPETGSIEETLDEFSWDFTIQ